MLNRTVRRDLASGARRLIAGVMASGFLWSAVFAQSAPASGKASPTPSPVHKKTSPYRLAESSASARRFYQLTWGVDSMTVKAVESGQMIRFSYRVLDARKAKALNDKKSTPYLLDEKAQVRLVVPQMEKVGQLRQSSSPEQGKLYWMVFSNKGALVKPGNRVSVVIGKFRVDELVVE